MWRRRASVLGCLVLLSACASPARGSRFHPTIPVFAAYQERSCQVRHADGATETSTCVTVLKQDFEELVTQLRAACIALGFEACDQR
jgi:hypothetical protein